MEKDKVKRIARQVDGFLTDNEGELLYSFAEKCTSNGAIVEIGSWKGKSTIWLGHGSKNGNGATVYAVDPHVVSQAHRFYGNVRPFEEFTRNIKNAGVDDTVVPIVQTSETASKNFKACIELIFVDGAHEFQAVLLDFLLWFPKLVDGGTIVFHDTERSSKFPGPRKFVKDILLSSTNLRNVGFVDTITFGQKVKRNSIKDKLRNKYVFLLREHPILGVYHRFLVKMLRIDYLLK